MTTGDVEIATGETSDGEFRVQITIDDMLIQLSAEGARELARALLEITGDHAD